jgi:hypothetical protein
MGLDLYAGTLARYHSGAWETIVQQQSRRAGMRVRMIYATPPMRLPRLFAALMVRRWRRRLRRQYSSLNALSWMEGVTEPYWTDKPGHEAQKALVLAGAYAERVFDGGNAGRAKSTLPNDLPGSLDDDPAYRAASERYGESVIAVLECHMFLPSNDNWIIAADDAVGAKRFMTSTGNLARALAMVNEAHWGAEESQFEQWAKRGHTASSREDSRLLIQDGKVVGKEV